MNSVRQPAVLFVCTANVIRSPLAAVIFKQKLQPFLAFRDWTVESAGVRGLTGQPAEQKALAAAEIHGLDISQHIARRINRSFIDQYDLIVVMEQQQQEVLFYAFPEAAEKIFFIGELVGNDQDVPDPITKPIEEYLETIKLLKSLVDKIFIDLLLLAKFFWLKSNPINTAGKSGILELDVANLVKNSISQDPVSVGILGSNGFPDVFRYELMQMLLNLYPDDHRCLEALKDLAGKVPPSEEDLQWLQFLKFQAIVQPITCKTTISVRRYIHPQIEVEIESFCHELTNPQYTELFKDLEILFRKNYSPYKYRLNIWDLSAKYKQLPFKVGDYDQAYAMLKGIS